MSIEMPLLLVLSDRTKEFDKSKQVLISLQFSNNDPSNEKFPYSGYAVSLFVSDNTKKL